MESIRFQKTILISLLLILPNYFFAQTFQNIADSLVQQLPSITESNKRIDLLNEIAYVYRRISGDSTYRYAQIAKREAVKYKYIKGESIAHKNLGIAHYKFNSPKDSMVVHYKRAIVLAEKIDDYYTQAACNNNIALLYSYQKDPFTAIKHYLQGIKIFDKHIKEEKKLKALMLANVAHFQLTIDNNEKALHYIERAFDIARRNNYQIILTNYSDEYSRILTQIGKYDLAEQILEKGLAIGHTIGDEYAIIGNLNGLADLALSQNQCDKADFFTKSVPKMKNRKRFERHYLNNMLNYVKVAYCRKDYDKIIEYGEETIKMGDKFKLTLPQQTARKLMAIALETKGNYQKAYQLVTQYNALNDTIIQTKKIASAAELEARYEFSEKEKEINYLEREQDITSSYINRLWYFMGAILIGLVYIFYLLMKKRKASALINTKNKELNKYITSNLQLENFAYIASHDLKTPLLTIKSFVELVRKTANDRLDLEEKQGLDFAATGSNDMLTLVDDLMSFSTLQTSKLQKEKINLPDFVEYVLDLNKPLIESENAAIQLDIQTIYIQADRSKLLQLLQNLIQNAIKFHKKGKTPKVTIQGISNQNNYLLSVKDNGIGISPAHYEKIFLLFKRLHNKSNYQGTGIGLALCKKIVDMHDGKIWVESKPEEGSIFYCSFPK